jgi:acyl carrier protein
LERRQIARTVFQTIGVALGGDFQSKLSAETNFFRIGGSSLNSISTVYELRNKGCHISINEFMKAKNIGEIIKQVSDKKKETMKVTSDTKFIFEKFNPMEKGECIDVLSNGYAAKSTLGKHIPSMKAEHYRELLEWHWDDVFVRQGLSFMVKNPDDEVIGVTLMTTLAEKLTDFPNNPVKSIFDFIFNIERTIM